MCPSQQGKTSKNGSSRGRFSSLSYHSYHAAKSGGEGQSLPSKSIENSAAMRRKSGKGGRGLPNYLYFASMRSR